MIGVDKSTGGGMWTVAQNYLEDENFCEKTGLKYISTSITGSLSKRILFTAKALGKIFLELKNKKYDIVHIHMAEKGSVYRKYLTMIIARMFHCKIILHMHGAQFESWYQNSSALIQMSVRKIINKADKILILGVYWQKFLSSLLDQPQKLVVVHNAVAVPPVNLYNAEAKHILFLGVVGQRKGIYDLLTAMKTADSRLAPGITLWIYGPDENNIAKTIADMKLQHRVQYLGWLPADKKTEVFKNISLNVLPSYNEGLPMTILETMSFGIPNISTDIAAIPEAVNNINGILISPGDIKKLTDSIILLCENQDTRLQKSIAAYNTVKEMFSLSSHFSKILDIYSDVMTL